jgi:hypothetical protein
MRSDAGPITGAPPVWAGHVRAAWRLAEPGRAPAADPFPGIHLAPTPIAFYDSVAASAGPSGGGIDASLARGDGLPGPMDATGARSVIALRNGSFGIDESALMFERGDSLAWVRAETSNSRRGGVGGWDGVSRHVWGLAAGATAGRHAYAATFGQRGGAARLTGGEQQSSSGESGAFGWRYGGAGAEGGITVSRSHDFHESTDALFIYSRRDAQENRVRLHGLARGDRSEVLGELDWSEARIDRTYDRAAGAAGHALWGRAAWRRAAGDGRLTLRIAGGERPGAGGIHFAPGIDYQIVADGVEARVFLERVTESVWADLAPGQAPFLQSTWTGGLAVGTAVATQTWHTSGGMGFRFGQTASRAIASRRPVDDLWLRDGFRADPERFSFGLLTAGGEYARGAFESAAEGFALLRDPSALQPQVDPGIGFRARIGSRFTAFLGDLGVRIGMTVAGVGPRESEAPVPARLPGYVTLGAGASLSLADAIVTIDLTNLEDRRRAQVWIDHATGAEALGPGRTLRFMLTWRLFN